MRLSVIIVNYNVEHYLEQCLRSVSQAIGNIDVEVFVVDNHSVDGSIEMLENVFPWVQLIKNKENRGFSKANNQAIRKAKGDYILLLNPDTVVEEDTFYKVIEFMEENPEAGGLGVKIIDGEGNFQPESKRSLPTPEVAFYKISGLAKLFPKSKRFGKYHLSYLNNDEINEIEILSGSFMLLRKKVLDEIGLLDESFFMYGEDIDLSYRITEAGYKNYYYPLTRIIHYKGKSTKKESFYYVKMFYKAMSIFAQKHFTKKNAKILTFFINIAIFIRASLSVAGRIIKKVSLPIFDAVLMALGLFLFLRYWQNLKSSNYPDELLNILIPVYVFIWLLSLFFTSTYSKPIKLLNVLKGIGIGTIIILVLYSLLPDNYRFSRAAILFGAVWSGVVLYLFRWLLHLIHLYTFTEKNRKILIIGSENENKRIGKLLKRSFKNGRNVHSLVFQNNRKNINIEQLVKDIEERLIFYKIKEVVFCVKDIEVFHIINIMSGIQHTKIDYKMAPPEGAPIIRSQTLSSTEDFYTYDISNIGKSKNLRDKRSFDIFSSLLLFITYPLSAFFVKKPFGLLKNIFSVLSEKKTWCGYRQVESHKMDSLPALRKSVLDVADVYQSKINDDTVLKLNLRYARDYKISNDINMMWIAFRLLGK